MNFSKLIWPVLLQFFSMKSKSSAMNSEMLLLNAVTENIKKEIYLLIVRIMAGLVATGIIIYSLVVLGQHFNTFLLMYDRGPQFSVLFFTVLTVVCSYSLYRLFYGNATVKKSAQTAIAAEESESSVTKIFTNFMAGLGEGLEENSKTEKSSYKRIESKLFRDSESTH